MYNFDRLQIFRLSYTKLNPAVVMANWNMKLIISEKFHYLAVNLLLVTIELQNYTFTPGIGER